jgi:putative FmdB family regulatory protein
VPLYDYDCAACGRRFEVIHGVHADPPAACPLCGGGPVKKAITAASVHYRGTGWAKKDHRAAIKSGASSKGDEGSADPGSSGADSGSSGSDSGSSGSDKAPASSSDGETGRAVPAASGKAESSTSTAKGSGSGSSSKSPARASD